MNRNKIIILSAIILNYLSIIIPLFCFVCFSLGLDLKTSVLSLFIDILCLFAFFVSIIIFCIYEKSIEIRQIAAVYLILTIIFQLSIVRTITDNSIPEKIYLKLNSDSINKLTMELKKDDNFIAMNDIYNLKLKTDTLKESSISSKTKRNDTIIKKYNSFKKIMEDIQVYRVAKENNAEYFFTGGFLNDASGIAYSEDDIRPNKINGQQVRIWKKIEENYYRWDIH